MFYMPLKKLISHGILLNVGRETRRDMFNVKIPQNYIM